MKQGLHTKQTQSMAMTPQMQQSLKILQQNSVELTEFINQELEKNPFLVSNETEEGGEVPSDSLPVQDDDGYSKDNPESLLDDTSEHASDKDNVWSDDTISGAVYEDSDYNYSYIGASSGAVSNLGSYNHDEYIASQCVGDVSLREYLNEQINIEFKDLTEIVIAKHLTDLLDENGYLTVDLEDVSESLKCELKLINKVLNKLYNLEPSGVYAKDLAECLSLQLKDKDRFDPAMQKLMQNLDLVAKRDYKTLQKICGVDMEDLSDMCSEIKQLNPKPGNDFIHEHIQTVQADIYLKKSGSGEWNIELNNEVLPKILVNKRYYSQVKKDMKDKASKKFLSSQFESANFIARAVDQRARTILKVATEIVKEQDSFFNHGINHLKPLTLSEIATAIKMHDSTISRVINGKFLATHMGLFELRYFFTSSLNSGDGDKDISSRTVKYKIKKLIDQESPKKTLSDEKISKILKDDGVEVARRTVMKYRESMKIPSSVDRKRIKNN